MDPIILDALQLIHDHKTVMTLVMHEALPPEQIASLESLDELLSALRKRILAGDTLEYSVIHLEAARTLDAEDRD